MKFSLIKLKLAFTLILSRACSNCVLNGFKWLSGSNKQYRINLQMIFLLFFLDCCQYSENLRTPLHSLNVNCDRYNTHFA